MGDRYFLSVVTCPECGAAEYDVYYAPTCGFTEWVCWCGTEVDLVKYTGISYEDASNEAGMKALIDAWEEDANEVRR